LIACDKLPRPLCERVALDIERQQFAFVTAEEAIDVRLPMLAMRGPPTVDDTDFRIATQARGRD